MRHAVYLFTAILLLSFAAAAQDPTKVASETYKLQFENEYVTVLHVVYAAHAKVPVHNHSRYPAGYVYLSDSGPIRFVHTGWDDPVLTRPATRAGSFRLSPTRFNNETHAVENNGDVASEFLRIEIKTESPDRKTLAGRFAPFEGNRAAGLDKQEFENTQLRATRMISKAGEALNVSARPGQPSLIVVVSGAGEFKKGETSWVAAGQSKSFAVEKGASIEVLRFDFKTQPKKRN